MQVIVGYSGQGPIFNFLHVWTVPVSFTSIRSWVRDVLNADGCATQITKGKRTEWLFWCQSLIRAISDA